jgi:hypothetical protein
MTDPTTDRLRHSFKIWKLALAHTFEEAKRLESAAPLL